MALDTAGALGAPRTQRTGTGGETPEGHGGTNKIASNPGPSRTYWCPECGGAVLPRPVGEHGHYRWTCSGCDRDFCYDTTAPCFDWKAYPRLRVLHRGAGP